MIFWKIKKNLISTGIQELQWVFESKISLDEPTKSINSQANNKFPGIDDQGTKFYKHFSLRWTIPYPFRGLWLLEKLGTICAITRTGIKSAMYKFRL